MRLGMLAHGDGQRADVIVMAMGDGNGIQLLLGDEFVERERGVALDAALAQVRAGKLRALATLTPARVPNAPEIPTIAEAGFPGLEVLTWYGVFVPAKTPRQIVERMNTELSRIMFEPEVRERLASIGAEPMKSTTAETARFIREEYKRWAEVIKAAKLQMD